MKTLTVMLLSAALFSCREEIIAPDNPGGNINQPFIETYLNSYSFVINAGDVTYNVYQALNFNYNRAQVYISIVGYSSGSVNISVLSKSKVILYNKKANNEIEGEVSKIEGQIPETLHLDFQDFTGKLRLSVTRLQ